MAAPSGTLRRRDTLAAWLYLAPAGLVLLAFWILPAFAALAVSLTNWEGADTLELVGWVGARNYARTLSDEAFWLALVNTIHYVVFSVPLAGALGLGIAMALHRRFRGSALFRAVFFLPYVSAWVAVAVAWRYFYDPRTGPLNFILTEWLGLEGLRWLQEPRGIFEMAAGALFGVERFGGPPVISRLIAGPSLALASVIASAVWRDLGFYVVIFLAGLNQIDPHHYESARLDGASAWQRFRRITWPLLSPTTFFLAIVGLIGAFREFTPMLVMTPGGGPAGSTTTLIYYMYEKGFVEWKLGQGAAAAYLFFALVLVLTAIQSRLLGRRVQYDQ